MEIAFGILGQTAMLMHGKVNVNWASPRARQLFAALATAPNRRIPIDAVVDWVWAEHEEPPRDARSTLHQYSARLRQVFRDKGMPVRVSVGKGGCLLEVDPALLDHVAFQVAMARARRFRDEGRHDRAHVEALAAVRLWRDEPLADLPTERAEAWRTRWVRSEWVPANAFVVAEQLAVGQADAAAGRLAELEQAHPMELSLAKLRIRALTAADRPNEATDFYVAMRRSYREAGEMRAADELRAVHEEVLAQADRAFPRPVVAAPVAEVPVVRHLPPDIDDVAGRDELLAELDAFTSDSAGAPRRGVVVLTGGPGVGKTTVAARWAHRTRRRYRNGTVMLDLRGDSQATRAEAGEIVDTLLSLLDYPVDQLVSPIGRAAKLTRLLEHRPMLVILDNVRSTDQVASVMGVLASCTVLVVSRWRLKSLSAKLTPPVVTVAPLDARHAWSLLARRIGPRARQDQHGVAELVRVCQGNPLALTLVAERAAARVGTRLQTLASQLRDAEMLLDLGDEGDWPGTSLRSAFSLSYQALRPAEQRVFAAIGLHPGAEMTGEVIAATAGSPVAAVRRSLDVLVAAHLVDHPADLDRYRVHDLMHLFAASLAVHLPDVGAMRRRMVEFYLRVTFEAYRMLYPHKESPPLPPVDLPQPPSGFAGAAEARQWVLRERSTLTAVVALAAEAGLPEVAYTVPSLTTEIFLAQGHFADAVTGLTVAVRSAEEAGAVSPMASVLNDLGFVHLLIGNDVEAEQYFLRALELVEAHGIEIGRVTIMLNLARGHLRAGRAADAVAMGRETLVLAHRLGEPERCAGAAHRLADALVEVGGHEQEAIELYREALLRREVLSDVVARIRTHTALGALLTQLGRFAEAAEQCGLATVLVNESQDLPAAMKLNTVLAGLGHAQGDDRAALRHAHRAVELADRLRHATGQARALAVLAMILRDRGNRDDARALWERAAELYRGRARRAKAEQIEALLAELDGREKFIPAARDGERDTVAMPSPHLRLPQRNYPKV